MKSDTGMSGEHEQPSALDEHDDDYEDEDGYCFWCGGDGMVETDDPLWDGFGAWVPCSSCGGTGKAEDMTIW